MKKFFALVLVVGLLTGGAYSANMVAHEEYPTIHGVNSSTWVAHEEFPEGYISISIHLA